MFGAEENCNGEGRIPLLERVPSFDDLSRELASGTISRGRAIKLTAGALLGSALIPLFSASPAEARRRNPCKGKTPICTSTPGTTENCKGNSNCFCARTVEGSKKCVDITTLSGCPATNECDSSRNCSADEFCLVLSGCCGNTNNACVRRCPKEAV